MSLIKFNDVTLIKNILNNKTKLSIIEITIIRELLEMIEFSDDGYIYINYKDMWVIKNALKKII